MTQPTADERSITNADIDHGVHVVSNDVAYRRLAIVNIQMVRSAATGEWVLVDAGITGMAGLIKRAVSHFAGERARPAAIILTHGHFDHVGALGPLAEEWDVPIYAHELELPYLDGRSSYPPPDPTVGGGLMAAISPLYPRGPIDVSRWLRVLPENGAVPHLPEWRWLATPGHSPGHVSLWRESDRTLLSGDAVITTRQESAFAVVNQIAEIHGPPMYYTPDWVAARESVRRLAALEPEVVAAGHGPAMRGSEMRSALAELARDFDRIALPEKGRYVGDPARADETGVTYVPEQK